MAPSSKPSHDPGKRNSLSGVFINALFKDQIGNVWIGVDQFLDKFDPATERFTHYPVDRVKHITQDRAGILWLSSPKGLYRLDPATGQIAFYRHDPADPFSLSSNDVKSSGEDRTGAFWVATSMGLDAFDRKTGKVSLHVPLHEPTQHLSFYEDRFGVFWITFAMGCGLAVFDRKANRLTRYSFHYRELPSTVQDGVV